MNKKQEVTQQQGIIMFVILLLAYITFASNWIVGSNLDKQIMEHFVKGETVSTTMKEVVNYSITTARIFANFLAAWVLIKLNPKKAAILAMVFLSFSVLAVFAPSYGVYIGARMIMALGGSMIMVYMNTVIAKFVPADKKIITSALTSGSYNMGAIIVGVALYFLDDYIKIGKNWQHVKFAFAFATLVMFAFWLLLSKDFTPSAGASASAEEQKYGYGDVLKDRFLHYFSIGFGGFLFLYVISLTSLPSKLEALQINPDFSKSIMIFTIPAMGILGTIFSMFMGKKQFQRKPYLILHGVLMVSAIVGGILVLKTSPVASYVLFGIAGFVMASQYTVYLNLPFELPNMNPKKITIMFGAFWALGYTYYTIFNFVGSFIYDISPVYAFIFYIVFSCLYIICIFAFPETKPRLKK